MSRADRLRHAVAARDRRLIALVVGATVIAGLVAVRAQRVVLFDDAAITLRYASRLAAGAGWTYNDGDHTNGASSPLHVMLLAASAKLGVDLEVSARVIGAAGYAAAAGLVTYLGARVGGLVTGFLAGFFLVLSSDFQALALSGLETSLAVALGLAVLVALVDDHDVLAGCFLGLALLTKLDAAILALAVAAAYLVVRRRAPWRLALVSAAIVAPWLVFARLRFGSPVPFSMTQKASGASTNPAFEPDPGWILGVLRHDGLVVLVVLALVSVPVAWRMRRAQPGAALALGASTLWGIGTFALYSFVDLGDVYSWYRTGVYAPLALGAAATIGAGLRWCRRTDVGWLAWPALGVLVTAAVLPQFASEKGTTVGIVATGHRTDEQEASEGTRRDAGRYLREHARPGDVVSTCWGWVAFGAEQTTIAESCPLSTRQPVGPPDWFVLSTYPGLEAPDLKPFAGRDPQVVATFTSPVGRGGRSDVVRVQPTFLDRLADRTCALRVACPPDERLTPVGHLDAPSTTPLPELLALDLVVPVRSATSGPEAPVVTRPDASCLVGALTGALGGDGALPGRGLTEESIRSGRFTGRPITDDVELTPAETEAFVARWLDCGELDGLLVDEATAGGASPSRAECLARVTRSSAVLRRLVVATVSGTVPDPFTGAENEALQSQCPPG